MKVLERILSNLLLNKVEHNVGGQGCFLHKRTTDHCWVVFTKATHIEPFGEAVGHGILAIMCFLWFPFCRVEAGLEVTPLYGYFYNLFPFVPVVGLSSLLFFLLCLSQISLHTFLPS